MQGASQTKRVEELYDSRRGWTDVAQNLAAFGLLGRFRRLAARSLAVPRGSTVLDLCCGAGGNLKHLHEVVGPEGKIVGLDLSAGMLESAAEKVRRAGWKNVLLVRGDAAKLSLVPKFDGVVSTYSMSIVPDHRAVQKAAAQALKPGGRLVIFDRCLKEGGALRGAFNKVVGLGGPRWHADWKRRPWEDLRDHFAGVEKHEVFLGLYYIAWGAKPR